MASVHWSGSVKNPSSLTSTVVPPIVVVGMVQSSFGGGVVLPEVGMAELRPGRSRPGRRLCQ